MMLEAINEITGQIVEQLWPIKINLDEQLTIDKLKNKIYNEFMIPKKSQKWIIGRIFDDLDEVKLTKDNTTYNNSIFLIVSSSPVVEICDKIIEEKEEEEKKECASTKDTEQEDVDVVDKSLLTVNIINDIQKENVNCQEELLNGDSQLTEDTKIELVPISILQLEEKDENKLFDLYVQLSGEEPNVESSLVSIELENVKQNELIDDTNETELTSKQQDFNDNNKFIVEENEPEKKLLTLVEQQDLVKDETSPDDSSHDEIENIDKEKETLVMEFKQQDLEQNEMIPLESYHEIENIDEEKETLVMEFKQQDLEKNEMIPLESYPDLKEDISIPIDVFDHEIENINEEKESPVLEFKQQDLEQNEMIPLESYHEIENIDEEKETLVMEFKQQDLEKNEMIPFESYPDLKEDISIPIDVFDHEIENIDKEKESPVLEFKQQDLEQNEMIPFESYHEIENINGEKETLVLEFKQQDLEEDRSISSDSSHHEVDNIHEEKESIVLEEYITIDSLSSHHDDKNKIESISFDLTSKQQNFDNNNKFIVEEQEPDETSSITSVETLKIDDLKEIMIDLNDNYQLPSPIVIPNKKENDNYVKQLPLVIPESSYIEPAYKKNSRAFCRNPRESRVSSSVPELSRIHNVKWQEDDDAAVGFTNFTRDYESSDDEEVGGLRDYRANRHQSWQNQQFKLNLNQITINKQNRTLIKDEEEDLQMAIHISGQMYEKNNVINYNQNTQLIQQKPKKEINENPESSSLIELMMLEDVDLIQNFDDFQCPICLEIFGQYEGVILRDCHHTFCRDCLRNTIRHCEEPTVKCPYTEDYTCESILRDLEIKSLVNANDYEKHILKSLIYAENTACKNENEKSFHCLSPDCPGWCYYQGFELAFNCNVCGSRNCLVCKVIHSLDEECWDHFDKATNSQTSKLTEAQRQSMIEKREIMECSNCQVAIVKNEGCDGIICTMCKTMLCWPTRGPRWGPKGKGDISGGCRCGVPPGRTCHPECKGCH